MRGVAILGVLLAYTVWSLGSPPEGEWSGVDRWIERGMGLLVDGKFLTMFACLFGLGVAQQWRRWEAADCDVIPLHVRRMTFLLVVGLLHAALLRNGDILAPYALMGFVLLALRRVPTRILAILAPLLFVAPYVVNPFLRMVGVTWPERPNAVSGNYVADNLAWLRYWYVVNPIGSWPQVLGIMLAGVIIGRNGVIEQLAANRARAMRTLGAALTLALLTRGAYEYLAAHARLRPMTVMGRSLLTLLYNVNAAFLATAYGTALLVLSRSSRASVLLAPLRALGRMAFTNYLLQALLVVPFCLALGLFDKVTPTMGLAMATGVAALQTLFAALWLRRHQLGPLEKVWRKVTYGRRGG